MEFIEYYRIIRERIWLPLLMMVVAASAVALLRVLQGRPNAVAAAELAITEEAREELTIDQGRLKVTVRRAELVASDCAAIVTSDNMRRLVAQEIGLGPDDADKLELNVTRAGDAIRLVAEAPALDIAEAAADEGAAQLVTIWAERQRQRVDLVREGIMGQAQEVERQLRGAQTRRTAWQAEHGTRDPTLEHDILKGQVAQLMSSRIQALLDLESARTRLEGLREGTILPAEARQIGRRDGSVPVALSSPPPARPSPEAVELQQALVELRDMLETRTAKHPRVLALRQRIDQLQKATMSAPTTPAVTTPDEEPTEDKPEKDPALEAAIFDQQLAISGLERQIEWLLTEEEQLWARLDVMASLQREYNELSREIVTAETAGLRMKALLAELDQHEAWLSASSSLQTTQEATGHHPRGLTELAKRLVAAGVLSGMLGIMLAFLLHYVDTSYRDEAFAERALGYSVIGTIPVSDMPAPLTAQQTAQADGGPSAQVE